MKKKINDILPRFCVLFPSSKQEAAVYKGTHTDVSSWIAKGEGGTWKGIGVEYSIPNKKSSMVGATLAWLSDATGVSIDVINSVRQKTEEEETGEVHPLGSITLRSSFDGRCVCLRVDS